MCKVKKWFNFSQSSLKVASWIVSYNSQYADSMEQSLPWEANSHSAGQDVPHLLWKLEVHYHVQKGLLLIPILRQMNPVHTVPPYLCKIQCNIIFPSMPRSSKWSLPFRFSNQHIVCIFLFPWVCYLPCQSHPLWFNSLCSLFQLSATSLSQVQMFS
jgi:hypothetical protein